MNFNELIFLSLIGVFLFCGLLGIILTFYLGRRHIKEMDKVVYGFEIPNDSDSIFYKLLRIPNYAGAFLWKWSAQRSGIEKIRDLFDKDFQRPFKVAFLLFVVSIFSLVVALVLNEYVFHIS